MEKTQQTFWVVDKVLSGPGVPENSYTEVGRFAKALEAQDYLRSLNGSFTEKDFRVSQKKDVSIRSKISIDFRQPPTKKAPTEQAAHA